MQKTKPSPEADDASAEHVARLQIKQMELGLKWAVSNPNSTPRNHMVQTRSIERVDDHGNITRVPVDLHLSMPKKGDMLPEIHHQAVMDVLGKIFVRLEMPADNKIPFSYRTVLKEMGLTRSGANYEMIYEAINKYFTMEVTLEDIRAIHKTYQGASPYLEKARFIGSFLIHKPKDAEMPSGESYVRLEGWFADGYRDKKRRKFLNTEILSNLKVGYTRRIYELVMGYMGDGDCWAIKLPKLIAWVPLLDTPKVHVQMQKVSRARAQLLAEGGFRKIDITGRGKNATIIFYRATDRHLSKPKKATAPKVNSGPEDPILGDLEGMDSDPESVSFCIAELRRLMVLGAEKEGKQRTRTFKADLANVRIKLVATLEKWGSPDLAMVREALAETKSAITERRIKTTVSQYFFYTLGVWLGKKKPQKSAP